MLEIAGLELLPAWPVFLSFVAAGLALNIVPGADMTFIIASAARGGRRDGVIAALGVSAGTLVNVPVALVAAGAADRLRHISWLGRAARWLAAMATGALVEQIALASRRQT